MCAKYDPSREHRILEDCKPEEHTRSRTYSWAELISELYRSGRERHSKRIVGMIHAENFEQDAIQETLKDVSTCLLSSVRRVVKVYKRKSSKNYIFPLKELM